MTDNPADVENTESKDGEKTETIIDSHIEFMAKIIAERMRSMSNESLAHFLGSMCEQHLKEVSKLLSNDTLLTMSTVFLMEYNGRNHANNQQ